MPRMFRFKNLAVSVLPSESAAAATDKLKLCVFHSTICLGWTHCKFHTQCHQWASLDCYTLSPGCWKWPSVCQLGTCQHFSPPVHEGFDPRQMDPAAYAQQVAELKADLQAALREVEEHESMLGDVAKPTLAEVEEVEVELQGALREVGKMKEDLRRKKGK